MDNIPTVSCPECAEQLAKILGIDVSEIKIVPVEVQKEEECCCCCEG